MENANRKTARWHQYLCAFFAGVFITDGILNLAGGSHSFDMLRPLPYPWFDILALIFGLFFFWCSRMGLKTKVLIFVFVCGVLANILM